MKSLSGKQIREQILLQNHLFENLKKWLNGSMILSSLFLSAAVFFHENQIIFWTACVAMVLSVTAMLMIGLSVKRGKDNLKKLLQLLDQQLDSCSLLPCTKVKSKI